MTRPPGMSSTAVPRGVRTYKPRRSRIRAREAAALAGDSPFLLPITPERLDLVAVWGPGVPVVAEIGFGTGAATARMAKDDPATGILAIDVHTPGVGDLLWRISRDGLTNVRVVEADALAVLEYMVPPASLAGVRSFFPDPWPKTRHHKRRLVQAGVLDLAASRLVADGWWHLVTDWVEYAEWIQEAFAASAGWAGGVVDRPASRPVTRYEARALREDRTITDLVFTTDASGPQQA
ncbi:MAG: tRNA (guanosine(46)-N7)-methyltransferase TrmB [Actinomycetota bacterium]|nr:tRNA (guanosine(46)-N7)-methyltransferase TrmB [Actinomycetota bacterium]